MTLDLTKSVQTKRRDPVRILCIDKKTRSSFCVIGLITIGDQEYVGTWTLDGQSISSSPFDLVNDTQRHMHADLIIAWANGAEIQCRSSRRYPWENCTLPLWSSDCEYRIKP